MFELEALYISIEDTTSKNSMGVRSLPPNVEVIGCGYFFADVLSCICMEASCSQSRYLCLPKLPEKCAMRWLRLKKTVSRAQTHQVSIELELHPWLNYQSCSR